MAEIIVHGDAELILKVGLTAGMEMLGDPVPVVLSIGTKRPPEFLRVILSGGAERNIVTDVPTIIIEAWAARAGRALEMAQKARGLMHWFTDINGVALYDVSEFAGPGNLPDPLSDQARYTATYSVPMRSATVAPSK